MGKGRTIDGWILRALVSLAPPPASQPREEGLVATLQSRYLSQEANHLSQEHLVSLMEPRFKPRSVGLQSPYHHVSFLS